MVYNNPYQQIYQPMNYPQQMPVQQMQSQSQQSNTPQIQNGGFVSVPSEEMVYNYPVAMGNCVTFKIEGKPYVMEKSMGFSQLEAPRIKKFRLVEEETAEEELKENPNLIDELRGKIGELNAELDELRGEMDALKARMEQPTTTTTRRKKDGND